MGVDHTTTGSENAEKVEQGPAADNRPPPPPDRPGSDGFPSRADSRVGAAAANDTNQSTSTGDHEKSDSTGTTAESSNGEKPGATENKEPSVGSQQNEANKSSVDDTDVGQADRGASPERAVELPAPVAQTVENQDSIGRQDSMQHVRDASSENGAPLDRSAASMEAVEKTDNAGSAAGTTDESQGGKAETGTDSPGVPSAAVSDPMGSQEAEAPSSTPGVHDAARDASATTHPDAPPDEVRNESGRPVDASTSTIDEAQPPIAEHAPAADQSALTKPSEPAEAGDGTPPDLDTKERTGTESDDLVPPVSTATERSEGDHPAEGSDGASIGVLPVAEHPDAQGSNGESGNESDIKPGDDSEPASRQAYQVLVGDTPVRLHIDPVGAAAADKNIYGKDVEPEPAGDRMVEDQDGKRSREDRFRKRAYEIGDSAADLVGKAGKTVQDFLAAPKPTGHPETRSLPEASARHEDIDVGNVATGLVAAGILIGELGYRVHHGIRKKKGSHDAGDR